MRREALIISTTRAACPLDRRRHVGADGDHQGRAGSGRLRAIIEAETELLIAAPTLTEALVVAKGRELFGEMAALIADLTMTVVPFTEHHAYAAVRGYEVGQGPPSS